MVSVEKIKLTSSSNYFNFLSIKFQKGYNISVIEVHLTFFHKTALRCQELKHKSLLVKEKEKGEGEQQNVETCMEILLG